MTAARRARFRLILCANIQPRKRDRAVAVRRVGRCVAPLPRVRHTKASLFALPVTIRYRRYSTNSAHWWIGRALRELTRQAGCVRRTSTALRFRASRSAGYRNRPHPASRPVVALARPCADGRRLRHRGAAPRGARGASRRRRSRRLHRRRYQPCRFVPPNAVDLLALCAGCGLSLWLRRSQRVFALITSNYMNALWRHGGRILGRSASRSATMRCPSLMR